MSLGADEVRRVGALGIPLGCTKSGMRAKGMLSPRAGVYAALTVTCPATCKVIIELKKKYNIIPATSG